MFSILSLEFFYILYNPKKDVLLLDYPFSVSYRVINRVLFHFLTLFPLHKVYDLNQYMIASPERGSRR